MCWNSPEVLSNPSPNTTVQISFVQMLGRVAQPVALFDSAQGKLRQRRFLRSFSASRAFTSFFTSAAGRGLSTGKRMVPLETE